MRATQEISLDKEQYLNLSRTQFEVMAFHLFIPMLALLSIGICLLPELGFVPWWVIMFINIALTTQIVSLQHELIHQPASETRWNWLLRINLHVYSPFTVGFDEYRKLHLLHHQYTNGDRDPDYPMVAGGRLSALFYLAFAPEYWFFYVLRHRLIGRRFWHMYAARMVILSSYIFLLGFWTFFLLYLLPTKLAFGISFIIFSYEAHTDERGDRNGSWNLGERFKIVHNLIKLGIGPYAYNIAYYHASHHEYPWVNGRKLSLLTDSNYGLGGNLLTRQLYF